MLLISSSFTLPPPEATFPHLENEAPAIIQSPSLNLTLAPGSFNAPSRSLKIQNIHLLSMSLFI